MSTLLNSFFKAAVIVAANAVENNARAQKAKSMNDVVDKLEARIAAIKAAVRTANKQECHDYQFFVNRHLIEAKSYISKFEIKREEWYLRQAASSIDNAERSCGTFMNVVV